MKDSNGKDLIVTREGFGNHKHWYKVTGGSADHQVSVQVTCGCKFQSIEGTANGFICSHIRAALYSLGNSVNQRRKK